MALQEEYIVTAAQLQDIARAIKGKTKTEGSIQFKDFASKIVSIDTSGGTSGGKAEVLIKPAAQPDYVRQEALRVANLARQKITENSIVAICLSDSHYEKNKDIGVEHGLAAMKILAQILPVDFIAHLGDVGLEAQSTHPTTDFLEENLNYILPWVQETAQQSIPLFVALGNHDAGAYVSKDKLDDTLGADYILNNFTLLSGTKAHYGADTSGGGYCYYDLKDKKTRVLLLNSSENSIKQGNADITNMPTAQQKWIIETLKELNESTSDHPDPTEWSFIVLCHFPLDWGDMKKVSNIFKAYVQGTPITFYNDSTKQDETYRVNGQDFSFPAKSEEKARFIGQFHGHIHNFMVSQIYDSDYTKYSAIRMSTPNAINTRQNGYSDEYNIPYHEDITYEKNMSGESPQDTSFVVNVINPAEYKIYSFTYGAGPVQREAIYNFDKPRYTITDKLNHVEFTEALPDEIVQGTPFNIGISPMDGFELSNADTFIITMGGQDITNRYQNGRLDIQKVTGNIYIEISITKASYYKINRTFSKNVTSDELEQGIDRITPDGQGKFTYSETIRLGPGWHFDLPDAELTILMGKEEIPYTMTEDAIGRKAYTFTISEVTDIVTIIATAQGEPNFTNLVPTSIINTDSNNDGQYDIYNGCGWKKGYYISSEAEKATNLNSILTGLIPLTSLKDNIFYVGGYNTQVDTSGSNTTRLSFCTLKDGVITYEQTIPRTQFSAPWHGCVFEINPAEHTALKVQINNTYLKNYTHIRLSILGEDNKVIVSDTPITYGGTEHDASGYEIIYNKDTQTRFSNEQDTILRNESFTTTCTPRNTNYEITHIQVLMGGEDITDTAYSFATRTINIAKATGKIEITVKSQQLVNLLPTAIDENGNLYNTELGGYKTNYRLSTSELKEVPTFEGDLSGYIPITWPDNASVLRVFIKNLNPFTYTAENHKYGYVTHVDCFSSFDQRIEIFQLAEGESKVITAPDSNGVYCFTLTKKNTKYLRISADISDKTIVTVNQYIQN